jgi:hypothetical protein
MGFQQKAAKRDSSTVDTLSPTRERFGVEMIKEIIMEHRWILDQLQRKRCLILRLAAKLMKNNRAYEVHLSKILLP